MRTVTSNFTYSTLLLGLFFFLSVGSFGQFQDDRIFDKTARDTLTLFDLRSYYMDRYKDPLIADSAAKVKSATYLKQDHFIYLMNEIARVQLLTLGHHSEKALLLAEKLTRDVQNQKNNKLSGYFYNVVGGLYGSLDLHKKAKIYFFNSILCLARYPDSTGVKGSLINLGSQYSTIGKHDSALVMYEKAAFLEKHGIDEFTMPLKHNSAVVYSFLGKKKKSIAIYNDLLESDAVNDMYLHTYILRNLGEDYYTLGHYEAAIQSLEQSLQIASENSLRCVLPNTLRILSKSYEETGNSERAYYYLEMADSMAIAEKKKHVDYTLVELESKQQKEILQQHELIQKQEIDHQKTQQKRLKLFSIALFLLLATIAFLYYKKAIKNVYLIRKNTELLNEKDQHRVTVTSKKRSTPKKTLPELQEKLDRALNEKQVFKDQNLSLEKLAKSLGTNRSYLSEQINHVYGVSFRAVINKLRITEAKRLLSDKKFAHYSIEGIATSVGYRNISSFNASFKKETGLTPSYFRKNANRI